MNSPIAISSKVECILNGPLDNNDPTYWSTGIVKTHILHIESEHMEEKKYLNKKVMKCFNSAESYDWMKRSLLLMILIKHVHIKMRGTRFSYLL